MVSPFESRRSRRAPNGYVRGEATDCLLTRTSLAANRNYNSIREMVSDFLNLNSRFRAEHYARLAAGAVTGPFQSDRSVIHVKHIFRTRAKAFPALLTLFLIYLGQKHVRPSLSSRLGWVHAVVRVGGFASRSLFPVSCHKAPSEDNW